MVKDESDDLLILTAVAAFVTVAIVLFVMFSGCVGLPTTATPHFDPNTVPTARIAMPDLKELACPMSVSYIDVGQGDSEYLTFPNGKTLLIDTGNGQSRANENIAATVKRIDYLVITHDHLDHVGGMEYLENHYRVPDAITYSTVARGDYISIDDTNTTVAVLNPGKMLPDEENDRSVILEVTYNNVRFLFDGDASSAVEDSMLAGLTGRVDVLKVAHHGSKYSSSTRFLKEIQPRAAIISVGKNTYGHPSQDTLSRLAGISTYRTDRDGTIRVCTDGETYSVSSFLK